MKSRFDVANVALGTNLKQSRRSAVGLARVGPSCAERGSGAVGIGTCRADWRIVFAAINRLPKRSNYESGPWGDANVKVT